MSSACPSVSGTASFAHESVLAKLAKPAATIRGPKRLSGLRVQATSPAKTEGSVIQTEREANTPGSWRWSLLAASATVADAAATPAAASPATRPVEGTTAHARAVASGLPRLARTAARVGDAGPSIRTSVSMVARAPSFAGDGRAGQKMGVRHRRPPDAPLESRTFTSFRQCGRRAGVRETALDDASRPDSRYASAPDSAARAPV